MEVCAQFEEKAVRDLAWLISAPSLLTEDSGLQLLAPDGQDSQQGGLDDETLAWLKQLDAAPKEFLEALNKQTNVRRLGFYASVLMEHWLSTGPGWNTEKILTSVPLIAPDTGKQRTAGQLKLICRRKQELLHVESSLKFFADAAEAEGSHSMGRFVGPFLHENMAWRLAEAKRKVGAPKCEPVRQYIQSQLGELPIRSTYFLKGFIFRPLAAFRPWTSWKTPTELNNGCCTGWYTTDVHELSSFLLPGARLAVLPKLFWLGPAVARGEPPMLCGSELPGQEPVPLEPWEAVLQQVAQHFEKYTNALLLAELLQESGTWVEKSRGFVLPKCWDPKDLMSESPAGMKPDPRMLTPSGSDGFADSTGRFSDPYGDAPRLPPGELLNVVVLNDTEGLGREITVDDMVMFAEEEKATCYKTSYKTKLTLRAALCDAETAAPTSVCQLLQQALQALVHAGLQANAYKLLELVPRDISCSGIPEALREVCDLALEGKLCPRLTVKTMGLFSVEIAIDRDRAERCLRAALQSGERIQILAALEFLDAGSALEDLAALCAEAVDAAVAAPASQKVLDILCRVQPSLQEKLVQGLVDSGQHKIARKIGQAPRATALPVAQSAGTLRLPSEVQVVFVNNMSGLTAVLEKARLGGAVVGIDAEWQPMVRRKSQGSQDAFDHRVQLLQLAWSEEVFVLDLQLLRDEHGALKELFGLLLCPKEDGILAVGLGLQGDIQRLADSFPLLVHDFAECRGIELQQLCHAGALSQLCAEQLGLHLDKELQCSDWSHRPLSAAQIQYAALDAWALLPTMSSLLNRSKSISVADAKMSSAACASHARAFGSLGGHGSAAVVATIEHLQLGTAHVVATNELSCRALATACKTVACAAEDAWALCCLELDQELNLAAVAAVLGKSAARLATTEELRRVFQQPRGSVGPIGPALANGCRIIVHTSLKAGRLEFGAGSPLWQLQISSAELQNIPACVVAHVALQ